MSLSDRFYSNFPWVTKYRILWYKERHYILTPFSHYLCICLLCTPVGSHYVWQHPGPNSSQSDCRTNRKQKDDYLSVCCSVLRSVCLRVVKLSAEFLGDALLANTRLLSTVGPKVASILGSRETWGLSNLGDFLFLWTC